MYGSDTVNLITWDIGTQHIHSPHNNFKSKVYNKHFSFLSVWHVDALRKLVIKDTKYLVYSFMASVGVDPWRSSTLNVMARLIAA